MPTWERGITILVRCYIFFPGHKVAELGSTKIKTQKRGIEKQGIADDFIQEPTYNTNNEMAHRSRKLCSACANVRMSLVMPSVKHTSK